MSVNRQPPPGAHHTLHGPMRGGRGDCQGQLCETLPRQQRMPSISGHLGYIERKYSPPSMQVQQPLMVHTQRSPNMENNLSVSYVTSLSPNIGTACGALGKIGDNQMYEQNGNALVKLSNIDKPYNSSGFVPCSSTGINLHTQHLLSSPLPSPSQQSTGYQDSVDTHNCNQYQPVNWSQTCCTGTCSAGNSSAQHFSTTYSNAMRSHDEIQLSNTSGYDCDEPLDTVNYARAHCIPLSRSSICPGTSALSLSVHTPSSDNNSAVTQTCISSAQNIYNSSSKSTEKLLKTKQKESKV